MILLVGASASGKTAVGKVLDQKYGIKKVVTYTTRPMRPGEEDGKDYYFLTKEDFLEKKDEAFFFETIEYQGNFYGTARISLKEDSYIIVDPKGLDYYKNELKDSVIAFYLHCSKDERAKRMRIRQDSPESIEKRLKDDDILFSNENLKNIDVIIDCTRLTIDEIAGKIISVYRKL